MRTGRQACGLGMVMCMLTACLEPTLIMLEVDTDDATATDGSSSSTSGSGTDADDPTTPPMGSTSTGAAGTTGEPDPGSSSSSAAGEDDDGPGGGDGDPPSLGPACSVQEVTRGDIYNPLPRGEAGAFPPEIADALEDYCGCHTLEDNSQNIEWEFLRPPGGTLFLTLGDLSGGYGGTTLGNAMAASIGGEMPPGSCGNPNSEAMDLLVAWFELGMPDAVDYEG